MTCRYCDWKDRPFFNNKKPLPSQIRACYIANSGSGKTTLLIHQLLDGTYDYNKLVLCSPSLVQDTYQIIILGYQNGLHKEQIMTLFEVQDKVKDYRQAIQTISRNIPDEYKSKIEVITYNHPNELPKPEQLNPDKKKQVLVVIDDSTILKSDMPGTYFSYCRPLNINVCFLSQQYTKVKKIIRENTNVFYLWKQTNKTIKENIFPELNDSFDSADQMLNFFKKNIKEKHDYIVYLKDIGKWYDSSMRELGVDQQVINQGMSIIDREKYMKQLEAAALAHKMHLQNRAAISGREVSKQELTDTMTELMKPVVKPLKEEIVKPVKEEQEKLAIGQEEARKAITLLTKEMDKKTTPGNPIFPDRVPTVSEPITPGIQETVAPPSVGMNKVNEYLTSKENRDDLFGIIRFDHDQKIRFGLLFLFHNNRFLNSRYMNLPDHEFIFEEQADGDVYVEVKRHGVTATIRERVTDELLAILTKNVGEDFNHEFQTKYKKILKLCLGPELDDLYFNRGRGRPSNNDQYFLNEFSKHRKWNEIISKAKMFHGLGYRQQAENTIIIPPDSNSQLRRIFVLLGSKEAGNSSDDSKEFTSLLDQMYKDGKLSKGLFKTLYWRYKKLSNK